MATPSARIDLTPANQHAQTTSCFDLDGSVMARAGAQNNRG
jgi:hypothetical protein